MTPVKPSEYKKIPVREPIETVEQKETKPTKCWDRFKSLLKKSCPQAQNDRPRNRTAFDSLTPGECAALTIKGLKYLSK